MPICLLHLRFTNSLFFNIVLNTNNVEENRLTVHNILLYRDEIRRIYDTYRDKDKANIRFTELARNATNKQEGRSISVDTISDFIKDKLDLALKENKKAMIYI